MVIQRGTHGRRGWWKKLNSIIGGKQVEDNRSELIVGSNIGY